MNHYLIRDALDSPHLATADTLDEALISLGLDANTITKAEQMIKGAYPPDNWKSCPIPKSRKELERLEARVQKAEAELTEARKALAEYLKEAGK